MKNYTRIIVAVTLLFGLSVAAKAESDNGIVVTLPFQFVVRERYSLQAPTRRNKCRLIDSAPLGSVTVPLVPVCLCFLMRSKVLLPSCPG